MIRKAKFRNMGPRRSRFLLISEYGSPGGTHSTGTHNDFLLCIIHLYSLIMVLTRYTRLTRGQIAAG